MTLATGTPEWKAILERINALSGLNLPPQDIAPAGGGCISRAAVLRGGRQRYFLKYNDARLADMFAAEAQGLEALGRAGAVRVPAVVCHGVSGDTAFLVLEYLELAPLGDETSARLGRELARLHSETSRDYGWHRDNTIGSTPQVNRPAAAWDEFFRERRLRFQLDLAAANGYRDVAEEGERLLESVGQILGDHHPPASLLHGDLWSGNAAATSAGEPVLFDPAVYYGDRETDLAMTELFGGFSPAFYRAYNETWPLPPGYEVRRTLYNLYHVLNHLNLFGGGYAAQALRMMRRLLAEVR